MVRSLAILALVGAAFAAPVSENVPVSENLPIDLGSGHAMGSSPAQFDPLGLGDGPLDGGLGDGGLRREVAPVSAPATGVTSTVLKAIGDVAPLPNTKTTRDVEQLNQRNLVDIEAPLYAVVKLLVQLCADAHIDVKALLANVKVSDSTLLSHILDGDDIHVARSLVYTEAEVIAAIKAFLAAAIHLHVPVEVALANIGIKYSDIASGILDWDHIHVLSSRDLAHVLVVVEAILKAVVAACIKANVPVKLILANISIKDSKILSNILSNDNISILRRNGPELADIVVDLLAYVAILVEALAKINVDVVAKIANIGIDCSSILSNIANGNNISILDRDLVKALLPVKALIYALIQILAKVDAKVALSILNIFIKRSLVASNILNNNVIHIL